MKILIAGVAGFVGSNLALRLLAEGHDIVGVDNFLTGQRENAAELSRHPNFTFWEGGIETDAFVSFIRDCGIPFDRVYDLACPTGVPNISILGEEMLDACSTGTRNLLVIARAHGARFLLTSSSEVYGDPEVWPQTERYTGNVDPIGQRANYEEGKRFAETIAKLYATKYGVQAVIVRLFNAYGPRMSRADFRVIPQFAAQALSGTSLTVHGDGSQSRTFCYVDDTIDGIIRAMEQGAAGEAYNIGGDEQIAMRELAENVITATGSSSEIVFTPRASHDHAGRLPDLAKIHALGWEQKVPLQDGLSRTLAYFTHTGVSSVTPVPVDAY